MLVSDNNEVTVGNADEDDEDDEDVSPHVCTSQQQGLSLISV